MTIAVSEVPSCLWILEGENFWCQHDEYVIEDVEVDTMTNGEHDTYMTKAAYCADPQCGVELEGFIYRDEGEW